MSIFTKTGDNGDTSLFGGKRVKKSSSIITAIGDVDELSACVAILAENLKISKINDLSDKVEQISKELFTVGADLANPQKHEDISESFVSEYDIQALENDITLWEKELTPLTHFVLPAGKPAALSAYYARAVCRRAERSVVRANDDHRLNPQIVKYLNRLADWLFVCFRLINRRCGEKEKLWNVKA